MHYKVFKQFPRDEDRICAQFNDLTDAKLFIENKAAADAQLKVKVIYKIYKGHEIIQEVNSESYDTPGTLGSQPSATQGGGRSSGTPTPFMTAPKPAGVPNKWSTIDKDKDDDQK